MTAEKPIQFTAQQVKDLIRDGIDPIKICADKYRKFKEWCEYVLEHESIDYLCEYERTDGGTCALCVVYHKSLDDCPKCPLSMAGYGCNQSADSPWRVIGRAVSPGAFDKATLMNAIDNMINILDNLAKDSNYVYEPLK